MTRAQVRDQILTAIQNLKSQSETGQVTVEQLLKDETLLKALGIDSSKQSLELWGWNKQGQFTLLDMNSQQNVEEWLSWQKIILAVDPVLEGQIRVDFENVARNIGKSELEIQLLVERNNGMPPFLRNGLINGFSYRNIIKILDIIKDDKIINRVFNEISIKQLFKEGRKQLDYSWAEGVGDPQTLVDKQDLGSIWSTFEDDIKALLNIFPSTFPKEIWDGHKEGFENPTHLIVGGEPVQVIGRTTDNEGHSIGFFNRFLKMVVRS